MAEPSLISKTYPRRDISPRRHVGILTFFGVILFLAALVIAGGIFLYKGLLERQIQELTLSLKRLEADFEPPLIQELSRTSRAVGAGTILLGKHRFPSRFFRLLEQNTLESIRFTDFRLDALGGKAVMVGEARSYTALAQQASIFEQNLLVEGLTLADLSLRENGNINFSMEIIFDPALLASS